MFADAMRRTDGSDEYAWLELGIGLYAAATPWILELVQRLYASAAGSLELSGMGSYLVRFGLALLALLAPTFLMGGTLPLIARALAEDLPRVASTVGRLYGLNTVGAAIGTIAAGYLLLPALGMRGSIFVGVVLNLAVAAIAFALSSGERRSGPASALAMISVSTASLPR